MRKNINLDTIPLFPKQVTSPCVANTKKKDRAHYVQYLVGGDKHKVYIINT